MKGSVSMEIFGGRSIEEICDIMTKWISIGWGWNTDQIILTKIIEDWSKKTNRVIFLNHDHHHWRADRLNWEMTGDWKVNFKAMRKGKYFDAHLLRPLDLYWKENKMIFDALKLNV